MFKRLEMRLLRYINPDLAWVQDLERRVPKMAGYNIWGLSSESERKEIERARSKLWSILWPIITSVLGASIIAVLNWLR